MARATQNRLVFGHVHFGHACHRFASADVYTHEVIVVHSENFVDPVHAEMHTETIEGIWMQAKRKLRYQSVTTHGLFPNYLSTFQWRNSHKLHIFGQFLGLLSDNYNI